MVPEDAAELWSGAIPALVARWEVRANQTIPALHNIAHPSELRRGIADFLNIATADPSAAGEVSEALRDVAQAVASLRARLEGYSVGHLVEEFHLLREAAYEWAPSMDAGFRARLESCLNVTLKEAIAVYSRLTEEALPETNARLQTLLDHAGCILWSTEIRKTDGESGATLDWKPLRFDGEAAQRILPLALLPRERYFTAWWRLRRPKENAGFAEAIARQEFDPGQPYRQEFACVDRHGRERWLFEEINVQRLGPGHWRAVGVVTDITERKRSEAELRYIAGHARCILWSGTVTDHGGTLVWDSHVSDPEAAQSVLPLEVPDGWGYIDVWYRARHPGDSREVDRRGDDALQAGRGGYTQEYRVYNRAGAMRWLHEEVTIEPLGPGRWRVVGVSVDITDRKLAEEAARSKEEELRIITDALPAMITYIDRDLRYRFNNRTYETWFGKPLARITGRHVREVVGEAAFRAIRPYIDEVLAGREVSYETRIRRWRGGERHVHVDYIPRFDVTGYVEGYFALVQDLTERKALEEALLTRAEELAAADRQKDEFLAMLAHELRNPLAPILSALHLLRLHGPGEPALQRACEIVDRQVHNMVRLIDGLLDVSRITRGKIELRTERVDLAAAVRQVVEASRPLAEARQLELCVSLPAEAVPVEVDPTRFEEIVTNLLTNAAKFTAPGGRIRVAAGRDGDEAVIRISDTGIGIAPDVLPRIFDVFAQADQSLDRSHGGLGIGLTIARRLAELHGGSIAASSAGLGRGSEFEVRLPALRAPVDAVEAETRREASAPAGRGSRVLIVDDNEDAAHLLADVLLLHGHDARIAYDGPSGLETARRFAPHVVLLDIGLPGMDGYEIARRLRHDLAPMDPTLVAVTGYGQEKDRLRSRAAGFQHHLVKPVDIDRLIDLLNGIVEGLPAR